MSIKLTNEEITCQVYYVKDLQKLLGIGRDKAYALMKSAAFPSTKMDGRYYITKTAFKEWLKAYESHNIAV